MVLQPIKPGATPESQGLPEGSEAAMNFRMQVEYYSKTGFLPPWTGYLAEVDGVPMGMGAFKGPPARGKVEIAYVTFPEHQGRGMATATCRALVEIALAADPSVEVTARTLPEGNASTRVLARNGFVFSSAVQDPEDGEVWEWRYAPSGYISGG
jgi:[ribosomal protein S5]-alanine N-acetyltransferase